MFLVSCFFDSRWAAGPLISADRNISNIDISSDTMLPTVYLFYAYFLWFSIIFFKNIICKSGLCASGNIFALVKVSWPAFNYISNYCIFLFGRINIICLSISLTRPPTMRELCTIAHTTWITIWYRPMRKTVPMYGVMEHYTTKGMG